MKKDNWIQNLNLNKGALRKKLQVKQGEDIPLKKLKKAEKSLNPKTRKQAVLAENFKKMRKK